MPEAAKYPLSFINLLAGVDIEATWVSDSQVAKNRISGKLGRYQLGSPTTKLVNLRRRRHRSENVRQTKRLDIERFVLLMASFCARKGRETSLEKGGWFFSFGHRTSKTKNG